MLVVSTSDCSINRSHLPDIVELSGTALLLEREIDDLLSSELLADLRIFTGARVVYALTAPGIAGAVCQTHIFDYRRHSNAAHFGPPLSSVEIVLTGHREDTGIERAVEGQVRYDYLSPSHARSARHSSIYLLYSSPSLDPRSSLVL